MLDFSLGWMFNATTSCMCPFDTTKFKIKIKINGCALIRNNWQVCPIVLIGWWVGRNKLVCSRISMKFSSKLKEKWGKVMKKCAARIRSLGMSSPNSVS